jgi:hypothetical protein
MGISPQGQRLRTIILTVPIMVATSGLQQFLRPLNTGSRIPRQWYFTNGSCSENVNANSLAPANTIQTVK